MIRKSWSASQEMISLQYIIINNWNIIWQENPISMNILMGTPSRTCGPAAGMQCLLWWTFTYYQVSSERAGLQVTNSWYKLTRNERNDDGHAQHLWWVPGIFWILNSTNAIDQMLKCFRDAGRPRWDNRSCKEPKLANECSLIIIVCSLSKVHLRVPVTRCKMISTPCVI
jgi:hypothetical protein